MRKLIMYILIICFGIFLFVNIIPLFIGKYSCIKTLSHYDVIVVLGNPANNDCTPAPIMRERVNKGVQLFQQKLSGRILFTGSAVGNQCNESKVMSQYAISLGVPDSCIITEDKAENTYQNAYYTIELMKKNNYKTIAIVTSEFHIKRACNIFSNYKINFCMFECSVPTDISLLKLFIWHQRENLILTYHSLFGYDKNFGLKR